MRLSVFVLALLGTPAVWGQMMVDFLENRPDLTKLYERVTRSDFVVIGRPSNMKLVAKRSFQERVHRELAAGATSVQMTEEAFAGVLITIDVEKTLCRMSDFTATASTGQRSLSKAYVFYPARQLSLPSDLYNGRKIPREDFSPGRRHLLYLYQRGGAEEQKKLTAEYELDPALTYYRALEGAQGARVIPEGERANPRFDFVTPAVAAIGSYCQAVDTPDVLTKIQQLKVLQLSAEPYWRDSIVRAIQALEAPQPR